MSNLVLCTKLDTSVSKFYYHSVDIFPGVPLVPGIIIHTTAPVYGVYIIQILGLVVPMTFQQHLHMEYISLSF
jgi:hypothetical protein